MSKLNRATDHEVYMDVQSSWLISSSFAVSPESPGTRSHRDTACYKKWQRNIQFRFRYLSPNRLFCSSFKSGGKIKWTIERIPPLIHPRLRLPVSLVWGDAKAVSVWDERDWKAEEWMVRSRSSWRCEPGDWGGVERISKPSLKPLCLLPSLVFRQSDFALPLVSLKWPTFSLSSSFYRPLCLPFHLSLQSHIVKNSYPDPSIPPPSDLSHPKSNPPQQLLCLPSMLFCQPDPTSYLSTTTLTRCSARKQASALRFKNLELTVTTLPSVTNIAQSSTKIRKYLLTIWS